MLLIDGVHMLVIVNLTQVDLVLWVVVIVTTQAKDGLYCNRFPMDMFLFLIVKVFECLHH